MQAEKQILIPEMKTEQIDRIEQHVDDAKTAARSTQIIQYLNLIAAWTWIVTMNINLAFKIAYSIIAVAAFFLLADPSLSNKALYNLRKATIPITEFIQTVDAKLEALSTQFVNWILNHVSGQPQQQQIVNLQ